MKDLVISPTSSEGPKKVLLLLFTFSIVRRPASGPWENLVSPSHRAIGILVFLYVNTTPNVPVMERKTGKTKMRKSRRLDNESGRM